MIRSRRAVQVLLLTGIVASGACAAPLAYNINFSTDFGSPTPTSGSFTYDSAAALGSQFTAFDVEWDGLPFVFTSQANTGGNSIGCGATDSATIFLFLSGTNECPGSNSFNWSGGHGSFNTAFHIDDDGTAGTGIQLIDTNAFAGTGGAGGTYSITRNDAPPVPEPSSFILALAGVALLVQERMRPATRKERICL